jgi:hypothetical protein
MSPDDLPPILRDELEGELDRPVGLTWGDILRTAELKAESAGTDPELSDRERDAQIRAIFGLVEHLSYLDDRR